LIKSCKKELPFWSICSIIIPVSEKIKGVYAFFLFAEEEILRKIKKRPAKLLLDVFLLIYFIEF